MMNESTLKITERTNGSVVILDMAGSIDIETHDELAGALDRLRNLGRSRVLINLLDVEYIDSRGLFFLINFSKDTGRINESGVKILLPQKPESLARQIFEASHLERILPVYYDLDKAIADFDALGETMLDQENSALPTIRFSDSGGTAT